MEEGRWSFTFFRSFYEAAQAIDDKEMRADFYEAVCEYAIYGTVREGLSGVALAMFMLARPNIDVSRKKAEAGSRGGKSTKQESSKSEADDEQPASKPKTEDKQDESTAEANGKQNGSKTQANDKQTASDRDKRKEIEKGDRDISLTVSDETVCRTKDVRRVQEAWNSLDLTKITKILPDTNRGKMLKKRIKEYGVDAVIQAIENIRASSFLNGQNNTGWQVTFDWFIKPNNFSKVLEGNYDGVARDKVQANATVSTSDADEYDNMKRMLAELKGGG